MTTIAQDSFDRSDRSLDGDTMSDGSSTWALGSGAGWSIAGNEAYPDGNNAEEYCDSMASVADVKVSAKFVTANRVGVVARWQSAGNLYLGNATGVPGVCAVYKYVSGTPTQIGSNGSTVTDGSILRFEVQGSAPVTLKLYDDGVLEVDTSEGAQTHGAGKCGVRSGFAALGVLDDWIAETLAAAGNPWYYYAQQGA